MQSTVSIGQKIFFINKCFKLFFKRALKPYDLNSAEAMALLMLYGQEGGAQPPHEGKATEQLLAELHYDKGVMSRTIHALESKGYVQMTANPADNRSRLVTLTQQALDFKPQLLAVLRQWSQGLLQAVANPDLLCAQLQQVEANAGRMLAQQDQEARHE